MGIFDDLFGTNGSDAKQKRARSEALRKKTLKENLREVARPSKLSAQARRLASEEGLAVLETGKIYFPTASARALWIAEITGQISDGVWENLAPHKMLKTERQISGNRWHWVYWAALTPLVGRTAKVVCKEKPFVPRADYKLPRELGPRGSFTQIHVIRERMLDVGRATSPLGETYDEKDLLEDLRSIRKAMESAWGGKGK